MSKYPLADLPPSLLSKLGSIAVHVSEAVGADGHMFDAVAASSLVNDDEVQEWLVAMDALALLPKKRRAK